MAAPAVVRSSGPPLCPSFAEVCSFLERYGLALDLPELSFPQMERYLRDTTTVPKPLVDLHVKLLRKLGKSVTTDRWEKYLAKVCQELNSTWAWELEQKGYQEMSMECKSSILKYLCECQFDDNLKFKTMINDEDPDKMRLQPIGRDRQGLLYWFQLDQEQNIRLYTEEQDDLDGSTWRCIVRTRNDLADALELLKTQVEPNQNQGQEQTPSLPRGSTPAEKGDEVAEISDARLSESTKKDDCMKVDPDAEKMLVKQEVKDEQALVKQENTDGEPKEERANSRLAAFDNRVSTITTVKSEPKDVSNNSAPIVTGPSVQLKRTDMDKEAERAAVRSNQQAKIPLKKRDLKLADSFHTNHLNSSGTSSCSSIIVCNPAVLQSRDRNFLNSSAPPCGPTPPQQNLSVGSLGPELTNGKASIFQTHREGQNGMVGVIGHVGVIRSPAELHRTVGTENGPNTEPCGTEREDKDMARQSVLVRKETLSVSSVPSALKTDNHQTPTEVVSLTRTSEKVSQAAERKKSTTLNSSWHQSREETKTCAKEELDKEVTKEPAEDTSVKQNSHPIEAGDAEETEKDSTKGGGDAESAALREEQTEMGSSALPLKVEKHDRKDLQGGGLNGGVVCWPKVRRNDGIGTKDEQRPLEKASSELQKEGIRLKIKIPPHRRKSRGKKGREEAKDVKEEQDEGRLLRRSARICRSSALPNCRPSSKVAEGQRKKQLKKRALAAQEENEEEEDDEEEEEEDEDEQEQTSTAKKEGKAGMMGPNRKPRGKRRHRRPRWSNIRTKKRKPNEDETPEQRGQRKEDEEDNEGQSEEEEDEEENSKSTEIPSEDCCSHCGLPNHPELILLCDSCDSGYHTACLRPPVMLIPDGEWFCPPCQHKLLCEKLEEQLQNLDSALKKRERAERRRERLVYVGISVENIIPEGEMEEEEKSAKKKDSKKSKNLGRRSTRTRKHISYRFDDFDDAIDEAIEEDIGDLCGGVDRDITSILPEERQQQSRRPIRSQGRAARSKKKRRLNDLESDSTAAESEDEFMLTNSSEDEEFGGSGPEDDEEDGDPGSDAGSWDKPKRMGRGVGRPKTKKIRQRGKKKQLRRSEEESEEDVDSDQYSDMTDSDTDTKRRGLRRGHHQQVNYRETSESSDTSRASVRQSKTKPASKVSRERLSSDYSDAPSSRESEEDYYEEDDKGGRLARRRREAEELRSSRRRKQRKRERDEEEERGLRAKRKLTGKEAAKGEKRRAAREEELEEMGRGKRREILSQKRRQRLALMLKRRRPSTDEDEESEESDSTSEEDRPVRKRLNRIDSDDEDDTMEQKSSGDGRTSDDKSDSDSQVRGRGRGQSSAQERQSCRGVEKPEGGGTPAPGDDTAADRQSRPNGPRYAEGKEGQTDSINSAQNSPQS